METKNMHGEIVDAQEELDRCEDLMQRSLCAGAVMHAELYATNVAHFAFVLHPELRDN